jgi:hypothetical protein
MAAVLSNWYGLSWRFGLDAVEKEKALKSLAGFQGL